MDGARSSHRDALQAAVLSVKLRHLDDWHAALDRQMEADVPVKPTVRETLGLVADLDLRMAVVTSTYSPSQRISVTVRTSSPSTRK